MTQESSARGFFGLVAAILFGLGTLLLLSLVSYDPKDISLLHRPPNNPPHNFLGSAGATTALWLFFSFGVAAYLIPVACAAVGTVIWTGRNRIVIWLIVSFGAVVAGAFLAQMLPLFSAPQQEYELAFSGGIVGNMLMRVFGSVGAVAILVLAGGVLAGAYFLAKNRAQGPSVTDLIRELVENELSPGEILLTLCHFQRVGSEARGIVGLTDQRVWFFRAKQEWIRRKHRLLESKSVRFDGIAGVSSGELDSDSKTGLTDKSLTCITIWWDGNVDKLAMARAEGQRFVHDLRQLLAQRDILGGGAGVATELEKMAKLVREGVLNNDEWERAKLMLLGKPQDKREDAFRTLRKLYDLYKSGVLSQSEFNMKKWDILSRPEK